MGKGKRGVPEQQVGRGVKGGGEIELRVGLQGARGSFYDEAAKGKRGTEAAGRGGVV